MEEEEKMMPTMGGYVHGVAYKMMRLRIQLTGKASPSDEEWAEALTRLLDHLKVYPVPGGKTKDSL